MIYLMYIDVGCKVYCNSIMMLPDLCFKNEITTSKHFFNDWTNIKVRTTWINKNCCLKKYEVLFYFEQMSYSFTWRRWDLKLVLETPAQGLVPVLFKFTSELYLLQFLVHTQCTFVPKLWRKTGPCAFTSSRVNYCNSSSECQKTFFKSFVLI